jgi:hypothetical protein
MAIQPPVCDKQTGGLFLLRAHAALYWFGRKCRDLAPDLFVRQAQIISQLQIEPELGAGLEPVAEMERGIARNWPAPARSPFLSLRPQC